MQTVSILQFFSLCSNSFCLLLIFDVFWDFDYNIKYNKIFNSFFLIYFRTVHEYILKCSNVDYTVGFYAVTIT